jgi:hypothetical protein
MVCHVQLLAVTRLQKSFVNRIWIECFVVDTVDIRPRKLDLVMLLTGLREKVTD